MKILVSACLLGENCKYSGGNNYSIKLKELLDKNPDYEVVSFCPEVLAGLPIPREPIEYANGELIDKYGKKYESALIKGREETIKLINDNHFDLAITKAKSPSCGCGEIYDGTFTHTVVKKDGFAVELLKQNGIKVITENEL